MTSSYPLTEYRPQGLGHVFGLSGITALGLGIFGFTGSVLLAVPIGVGVCLQLYRSAGKTKDPDWCNALGEMWTYKLSPRHRSIEQDYDTWCEQYGLEAVNAIIEPLVGQCCYANFTKDPKHPYHGLRGVLVFDCEGDGLPPLTPHDYVSARLRQRKEVLSRAIAEPELMSPEPITVRSVEVVERGAIAPSPVKLPESWPTSETVSEAPPSQNPFEFLLSLTQAPLQPVIIVGAPGSGKGVLSAIALQLGKRRNSLTYWVFNPKASLKEAGYWDGAEYHFLKDRLADGDVFTDLMEVLDRFGQEGSRRNGTQREYPPMVLLLEEINALTGLLNPKQKQEFKAKVTALASLLRGCNMALWLSGQSINLEDLGLTGRANRAMFTAIAAVAEDRAATGPICEMLGIPYNPSELAPNCRYWLTSQATYLAPPAPSNIRQYGDWGEVANLVDLRGGQQEKQSDSNFPSLADYQDFQDYKALQQHLAAGGTATAWEVERYGHAGGAATRKRLRLQQKFGDRTPPQQFKAPEPEPPLHPGSGRDDSRSAPG